MARLLDRSAQNHDDLFGTNYAEINKQDLQTRAKELNTAAESPLGAGRYAGNVIGESGLIVGGVFAGPMNLAKLLRNSKRKVILHGTGPTLYDVVQKAKTTTSFYHKGNLEGGKVSSTKPLSTGVDKSSVSSLNRSGKVHTFEIPNEIFEKWKQNDLVRDYKDYDHETGVYNTEWRFDPSISEELNKFKVE